MKTHPHELLGAFADDELAADDARRVAEHVAACTECARELAIIRTLGGALQTLHSTDAVARTSVWSRVHRRITRPFGWVLLGSGVALWAALAIFSWVRQEITLEWLAVTAMLVGLAMLLIGIAHEQYSEWRGSPYRDVER